MASERYLLRYYGNTVEADWLLGTTRCYAACGLNIKPHSAVAERRKRPTGESGPGPYFHTYKRPPSGVSQGVYHKTADWLYVINGYYEQPLTKVGSSYAEGYYATITVAAPGYYYCISYRNYTAVSSLNRYREYASVYGLAVAEPFTDRKTETLFFGKAENFNWHSDSYADPILGWDYWRDKLLEKARRMVQDANVSVLLGYRVTVANLYNQVSSLDNQYKATTPHISYKYAEEECFDWCMLTGSLTHHCTSLASAAYINAVDNLPGATCNSIATVIESMHSLAGLFKGEPPKTPKGIKDLWLSYRYAVSTTKADVDEYAEVTRQLMSLANASKISCNGQCDDGKIFCQSTIVVDPSVCIPSDAKSWLKSYGFRLSALNAWDMVPFSFVVDWFLHIGDILEYLENFGDALSMPVEQIWYSFRTNYDGQDTYFRVPGRVYFALPYVSYNETSGKTIGKRILDSIALFT